MKTKFTRIFALLITCIMLISIVACTRDGTIEEPITEESVTEEQITTGDLQYTSDIELDSTTTEITGDIISTSMLASSLRDQFADEETVEHQESLWNVPRDQTFYVNLEFDIMQDTEFEGLTDVFAVYADAALTQSVGMTFEIATHETDPTVPAGHNRLYISPFRAPPGRIWGSFRDLETRQEVTLEESGDFYLHETEEGETWGFLRNFYLALHVDTQTGETLERPIVTIFTIENTLDAPHSEFFVTEDGYGGFRWGAVEGAEYYLVVTINEISSIMEPVAKVTGTEWIHPENRFEFIDAHISMNAAFRGRGTTEDDMQNPFWDGDAREISFRNFTVVAVNNETHSAAGNIHRGIDIAARLPFALARHTTQQDLEEIDGHMRYIPNINLLPSHRAITMASGHTVQRRIIYDFDAAEVREDRYYAFYHNDDGDIEITGIEYILRLHIPYIIEGTVFTGRVTIENFDPGTYRAQLEAVREHFEDTALVGGGVTIIDFTDSVPVEEPDTITTGDTPKDIRDNTGNRVFANSALSAFLAHNMLAANEFIDLTKFPESADFEVLADAFFEAIYQNPLILHVAGAGSIPGTNIIVVEYKEPVETIWRQQNAIRQIIPEIISEIITDDMTDLEISFAINQFLVDTTEYDWDALENAELFDFQSVDPIFNDSFTAYGILINRVGVCAGYAAAFRLLADEAGLESIVVTGHLEGFLPHAWNRVYIDGQWYTIDVTNNANEFLYNVFMHLPDDVASTVLVEDGSFMLNKFLGTHRAYSTTNEYYYVTDRFFGRDDISRELAELIEETGNATLRTDFDLDDDAFFKIAMEVISLLDEGEIFGFHWLGVIFMTDGR